MKKTALIILVLVLLVGVCVGCSSCKVTVEGRPEPTSPTLPETEPSRAEILLKEMTLEEKIGQVFIVSPEGLSLLPYGSSEKTSFTETMKKGLETYHVGGIIMFGGNIVNPSQLNGFMADFKKNADIPLFLCVDEEGGIVARLANNSAFKLPKYKSAASVGKGSEQDALAMGKTIGNYLKKYGFNVDFAPVADVFTNPQNKVIGNRAFSTKADVAALMSNAMAEGLKAEGIIPTFKHFPGHGDTVADSHVSEAVTYKTEAELENCEWLPFRNASYGDFVMVGHISMPKVCSDKLPATMSEEAINGILKGKLGFKGIVITDSLSMGAITKNYTSAEAAKRAFQAGCDILLMPENFKEAYDGLYGAVKSGEISEERLNESVLKILEYKINYGIIG